MYHVFLLYTVFNASYDLYGCLIDIEVIQDKGLIVQMFIKSNRYALNNN